MVRQSEFSGQGTRNRESLSDTMGRMNTDLILGTAGHIDHGKTTLIRALTGTDTDRLPEEKKRGITIELGFAELQLGPYRLGIVDVPGHERFVRNMLAGATGMDLAMLVVAADDSVKQQTREHLEILRLLDLQAGMIVLTKCDLVDPDWLDLVEEEVRELVADTFLADAPVLRTSATTGEGIDALREVLQAAAERAAESGLGSDQGSPFRLAIDRSFTIEGHGTVVTGSVGSGEAAVGDELVIEPAGAPVRIRSLQNHDRSVQRVHRGQRAAINLAGVHHLAIGRGQELASPGHLVPSRLLSVYISLLPSAGRTLKSRSRVRLHVGTAELMCSIMLLDRERLEPGESAPAQVLLSEPAVTVWNQPFVVRSESPVATIGGGHVLDPNAVRLRHPSAEDLRMLMSLMSADRLERASATLYFAGLRGWKAEDLPRTAGIRDYGDVSELLAERGEVREIRLSPTRSLRVHSAVIVKLSERIEAALKRLHEQHPLRSSLDRWMLANGFRYLGDDALLEAVLQSMRKDGRIRITQRGLALVGHGPKLSQNERKLLGEIIEKYREAGFHAPTVKEVQKQAARNQQSVPQLVALAAADGDLVEVTDQYFLHADVERSTRERLREELAQNDGLTLSQIREVLETTRKYAIPYCEFLDRTGFTVRDGDLRRLSAADTCQ